MTTTELVKALRICFRDLDDGADCPNCPLYGNENCLAEVMGGAADLIEWLIGANANLHEELEQKDKIQAIFRQKLVTFEAERDAAIADLKITAGCASCEYKCYSRSTCCDCTKKQNCKCMSCHLDRVNWQWRGLPEAPEEGEKA